MNPEVSIVILNWNGWRDTIECLSSLLRVDDVNFEVVVVDNASSDDSVAELVRWARSQSIPLLMSAGPSPEPVDGKAERDVPGLQYVTLLCLSENIGFCAGNNLGLRHAQMRGVSHAVILNNDTIVDPGFLSPLVAFARANPSAGLLGCQIRYAMDRSKVWWAGGRFNWWLGSRRLYDGRSYEEVPNEPYRTAWVSGCMTFIPLAVFSKIGGYDERFFIWCDEWDLSLRADRAGYEIVVVPSSVIYHKVGRSLGLTSPLTYYYSARNLLLLRSEYLPGWVWACFLIVYVPYKLFQALHYAARFGRSFWPAYRDSMCDFIHKRFGRWNRHRERGFA